MPLSFAPFSEHKPLRIYRTNLPHWRQDGCTYFVTFRLADSIPHQILDGWQREKADWLAAHGIEMDQEGEWMTAYLELPGKERFRFEKIFNRKMHEYLDRSHGRCLLADPAHARTLSEKLLFFDRQRYELGDYVIMPNHVHLLICPGDGYELEKILQSIKKESSRAINNEIGTRGSLWQKDSYDHVVRDRKELSAFQRYIAENPEKGGMKPGSCLHQTADYE